jgi:hypothetical protein
MPIHKNHRRIRLVPNLRNFSRPPKTLKTALAANSGLNRAHCFRVNATEWVLHDFRHEMHGYSPKSGCGCITFMYRLRDHESATKLQLTAMLLAQNLFSCGINIGCTPGTRYWMTSLVARQITPLGIGGERFDSESDLDSHEGVTDIPHRCH